MTSDHNKQSKLAVVTGGARRIGAVICSTLHRQGYDIVCTWRRGQEAADALVARLCAERPDSAWAFPLDLGNPGDGRKLAREIESRHGRLDALVNNASTYFPTEFGQISERDWTELIDANARGPLFLAQNLRPLLDKAGGSIVSLIDADIERAIPAHTVYTMAKAALAAMTRSLALEMAPRVRVNAVAPGSVLWSEDERKDPAHQQREIDRCFLGRTGTPEEVAEAVRWLIEGASHTTGSVVYVDGGQHLRK